MTLFTFTAYNDIFTATAVKGLDVMEQANKKLLWSNKAYKQGAWFERGNAAYEWVEGNFFD
tara:strand:- start:383 stop:565 length:183 start_codon:yes stop_codon:yes gene_type:complete